MGSVVKEVLPRFLFDVDCAQTSLLHSTVAREKFTPPSLQSYDILYHSRLYSVAYCLFDSATAIQLCGERDGLSWESTFDGWRR